jgi:hypothetical protein
MSAQESEEDKRKRLQEEDEEEEEGKGEEKEEKEIAASLTQSKHDSLSTKVGGEEMFVSKRLIKNCRRLFFCDTLCSVALASLWILSFKVYAVSLVGLL